MEKQAGEELCINNLQVQPSCSPKHLKRILLNLPMNSIQGLFLSQQLPRAIGLHRGEQQDSPRKNWV